MAPQKIRCAELPWKIYHSYRCVHVRIIFLFMGHQAWCLEDDSKLFSSSSDTAEYVHEQNEHNFHSSHFFNDMVQIFTV